MNLLLQYIMIKLHKINKDSDKKKRNTLRVIEYVTKRDYFPIFHFWYFLSSSSTSIKIIKIQNIQIGKFVMIMKGTFPMLIDLIHRLVNSYKRIVTSSRPTFLNP